MASASLGPTWNKPAYENEPRAQWRRPVPGPGARDQGASGQGPGTRGQKFHWGGGGPWAHLGPQGAPGGPLGTPGSPPLIARYLVESQIGYIQIQIQFGIDAAGRLATPAQGCAGWARNPKGPQITPFCHQMSRHPTILDFKTGIRLRILARISPWGPRGPNPNFLFFYFGPKNAKK